MKIFCILVILLILNNCSFDNKTGIWKNEKTVQDQTQNDFNDFKRISSSQELFNKIIPLKKNIKLHIPDQINNKEWREEFYNQSNNFDNFNFTNLNQTVFKSKKLSKYKTNDAILFEKNNLIISDKKGNVIVFSINEQKVISKLNFYKKRYKKFEKNLNLIVENNIIYISDNIGYLYAYNYKENILVWAKNYKIPFNSNLKILGNKIFGANINNNLLILEKNTGKMIKQIPTEETLVQNTFQNNLSQSKNSILFLNSYGSLYSISNDNINIRWFINLNPSLNLNTSNLFYSNQVVIRDNLLVVSANNATYVIDSITGSIIYKINFSSFLKPILTRDHLFMISKNDLLISFNLKSGKVVYSYNINQEIAKFLNTKQKKVEFKNFIMANNHLIVFLKNSYVLKFNINGQLINAYKLTSKIYSNPIFVNGTLLYINSKKRLVNIN